VLQDKRKLENPFLKAKIDYQINKMKDRQAKDAPLTGLNALKPKQLPSTLDEILEERDDRVTLKFMREKERRRHT
jgi:hypothetical protein